MTDRRRNDDGFQREVLTELGNIKALCATNYANNVAVDKRVKSLENTNIRQWWLHGFQVVVFSALGLLRKAGVL